MSRRLLSLVLCASLGLSSAESLVADVHDGDATPVELARSGGPASGICPEAGPSEPGSQPGDAGHSAHVCHFGHAHGGWIFVAVPALVVTLVSVRVIDAAEHHLVDFVSVPQVPPPIA